MMCILMSECFFILDIVNNICFLKFGVRFSYLLWKMFIFDWLVLYDDEKFVKVLLKILLWEIVENYMNIFKRVSCGY